MTEYGELSIDLNGCPAERFDSASESAASGGWARDRSKDGELERDGHRTWFTFTLTGHASLPPAFLSVTEKDSDHLYVPNVISPARDWLTHDEYNGVLDSFVRGVLVPTQKTCPITFRVTNTVVDLATGLPAEVFRRLRRFSTLANKRTGSAHPLDQERWMDFIVAAHEAAVPLDPGTLARWLVEVDGWDAEQASHLAVEYEFGLELLRHRGRVA